MTRARAPISLGLASFAATAAYFPGILDFSGAPKWSVLAIALPLVFAVIGGSRLTIGHWLGAAVLFWSATTLLWTPDLHIGLARFAEMAWILGFAFVIGARVDDLRPAWRGLALGIGVSGLLVIAGRLGWVDLPTFVPGHPAGLFFNPDMLGETAAVALVATILSRDWWFIPCSVIPWALTWSRASVVALLVVAVLALARRAPWSALALAAAAVGYVGWHFIAPDGGVSDRFEIWGAVLAQLTPLGHGIGSFSTGFPYYGHAHSEPLEMAYELGLGAAFLLALIGVALGGADPAARGVLIAVMAISFFAFPLELPVTGFVAALAAGHLCGHRRLVRGWESSGGLSDGLAPFPAAGARRTVAAA